MSLPLLVVADIGKVLSKHGVKVLRHQELNAMIAALSPCFEPGYPPPAPMGSQAADGQEGT